VAAMGGMTGGVTAERATICTGRGVSVSAGGNCLLGGIFLQAGVVGFKGTRRMEMLGLGKSVEASSSALGFWTTDHGVSHR
jgi:hypothetical protein